MQDCACEAGRTGPECLPCEAGLYKDAEGQQPCALCPHAAVAVNTTHCECGPGYTGAYNVSRVGSCICTQMSLSQANMQVCTVWMYAYLKQVNYECTESFA